MLLVKSCMKEHNIKNGTIKLGSLHEYRNTEKKWLQDHEEGIFRFHLKFEGLVEIQLKFLNTLMGGAINLGGEEPIRYPGRTSAHFEVMDIVNQGEHTALLKDSIAVIERDSLNEFIFCVSQLEQANECIDIFPNYNDFWAIPESKSPGFAVQLGRLLMEKIAEARKSGDHIIPENVPIDGSLGVIINTGLVKYMARETHITKEGKSELEDIMQKLGDMAFIKPPEPFQREKEFRFSFQITSNNRVVEPVKNHVILDAKTLQEFVL